MIISQLSIAPVGAGINLSKYVKLVVNTLKNNNVKVDIRSIVTSIIAIISLIFFIFITLLENFLYVLFLY